MATDRKAMPEDFETEQRTIPVLKDVLRGADYAIEKWSITEDDKSRKLTIVASRSPFRQLELGTDEPQGIPDGEE
jgi:hypothetical protein